MNRYLRLSFAAALIALIAVPAYLLGWRAAVHRYETFSDGVPMPLYMQAIERACPGWVENSVPWDQQSKCIESFEKRVHEVLHGAYNGPQVTADR
jgi:hypothetical protein